MFRCLTSFTNCKYRVGVPFLYLFYRKIQIKAFQVIRCKGFLGKKELTANHINRNVFQSFRYFFLIGFIPDGVPHFFNDRVGD
ncbi:MAG: hypothetical protein BACD_02916 [Bacteroides rodentium]